MEGVKRNILNKGRESGRYMCQKRQNCFRKRPSVFVVVDRFKSIVGSVFHRFEIRVPALVGVSIFV